MRDLRYAGSTMKQSSKTLLLWGLLVLMFLAIWQFLTPPQTAPAPAEPVDVTTWVLRVGVAGGGLALFLWLRWLAAARRTQREAIEASNAHVLARRFDEAEARLAPLAQSRSPQVRRVFHVQRAWVALARGDREGALAAIQEAIDPPVGRFQRRSQETTILRARSLRAFLRASKGDVAGARDDIAAVRAALDLELVFLARVSLAEARLLDEANDRAALTALLQRDRQLLLEFLPSFERSLAQAYEAMVASGTSSVYRQGGVASKEGEDDAGARAAAWVAAFAPNAAPFARSTSKLPAGEPGALHARAPSDEERRRVAAARSKKVSVKARKGAIILWGVSIGVVGGLAASVHSRGVEMAALSVAVVVTVALGYRAILRQRRDAARVNRATRGLAFGELPRSIEELGLEGSLPSQLLHARHLLAESALRRGAAAEAVEHCDRAFEELAKANQGTIAAPVAPRAGTVPSWDWARLLSAQRSEALAALGREDEAWAEIDWAKGYANLSPVFRVELLSKLHKGKYVAAAKTVETRDPELPLTPHYEALARFALFVGRSASRTEETASSLRALLARDPSLSVWIDGMAPGLLEAFERAAAERAAPRDSAPPE